MFENLPVSEGFSAQIETAFKNSRLSHALILEGSCEEVRLKTAKEIAKALVCKAGFPPCNNCIACMKASNSIHPDIHITGNISDSAIIKVDTIREIRSKALIFPNESEKSVFIIHEAQLMNASAQNALLKILEEPNSHVCFILTCPSKSSLLDTVISRATAYSIGEEYIKQEDEKAKKAKEKANELLISFAQENELSFIKKTADFQKDKQFFLQTLKSMSPCIRDCIICQNGGRQFISDYPETAKALSSVLTAKKAMELLETINKLTESIEKSANYNLTLTRLSAELYNIKSR